MGTRILFTGDSITDGNRYKEEKDRGDLNTSDRTQLCLM